MLFAIATRDELWIGGTRIESRLEHGEARLDGDEIVARDVRRDDLVRICERELEAARGILDFTAGARVRIVIRVEEESGRPVRPPCVERTLTVTLDGVSIVTDPDHARDDIARLRAAIARPIELATPPRAPILWRGGSAAIVFHEAVGHAAERGAPPLEWPPWLRVADAAPEGSADLMAGEKPRAMRRESFRDVPLPRMTSLVVSQSGAPFELPDERIEVHYVAGGRFDPSGGAVTVRVAVAESVTPAGVRRIAPFELQTTRDAVAGGTLGATGDPLRYPGVVCSSEGQELVVGSHAPLMLTALP